jgi:hypothetical protein
MTCISVMVVNLITSILKDSILIMKVEDVIVWRAVEI